MNESEDDGEDGEGGGDDGKSEKSGGMRSGNAFEDDWTDESNGVIRFVTFPCLRFFMHDLTGSHPALVVKLLDEFFAD